MNTNPSSWGRPDFTSKPVRISRRTALRQLALGGAAMAAGTWRCLAPAVPIPVQNNLLGSVMEYPYGTWWTQCLDYGGATCSNPIWKNLNANPAWGYVNNNLAGNSLSFTSYGGFSQMLTNDIVFNAGVIYQISWVGEIVNSADDLDELRFVIDNVTVDKMHRADLKSQRRVLFTPATSGAKQLLWHFEKAPGANSSIRFRADNLQIVQLPTPVLATFMFDSNHVVVWWDKVYGSINDGTSLQLAPSLTDPNPNNSWDTSIDPDYIVTDGIGATIGYGKIIDCRYGNPKFFRLKVQGTPAAP